MKKPLFLSIVFVSILTPFLVSADKITELGTSITSINTTIVAATATLFMALAMVAFFFGMTKFILASRDGKEQEIKDGKQFMLWSVIALFVMFSIYGIIKFGQDTIGLPSSSTIVIPTFQIGSGGTGVSSNPLDPNGGTGGNGGNGGNGGGGGTGACTRTGDPCYTCAERSSCICDNSLVCVFDYANPDTRTFLQTTCEQSGGSWNDGCDCPSSKPINIQTGQCESNSSTNPPTGNPNTSGANGY